MYLLDTDVLIWILRGNVKVIESISLLSQKQPVGISVISVAEIFKNIFPSELVTTEEFLDNHLVFEVDYTIAKSAGLYWQEFNKKLSGLSLADCLIAATARSNQATLLTLNTKHFPMRDIKVKDPSQL